MNRSVLVVDPSRTTQAYLRGLLEAVDLAVLQAAALSEALDCLRDHRDVGLVLIDETLLAAPHTGPFLQRVRLLSSARVVMLCDQPGHPPNGVDSTTSKRLSASWLREQVSALNDMPSVREPGVPAVPAVQKGGPRTPVLRVLVVDDSAVVRAVVRQALEEDPGLEVVGTAANGSAALAMVDGLDPDVVVLDLEMPVMDGLEALQEIRRTRATLPVILFTSSGDARASEAASRGATDMVVKPSGGTREDMLEAIRRALLPRLRKLLDTPLADRAPEVPIVRDRVPRRATAPVRLVAVGISTGGPEALRVLLAEFDTDFPVPIVVVQHMPAEFTRSLADRLSASLPIAVREVAGPQELHAGTVWVAAGGSHLEVEGTPSAVRGVLTHGPPENSCRPSVDVLFRSVARVFGARALGVVMTGMGQDGLKGAEEMWHQGSHILVQDKESSTVWGMPGAVAERGLADAIVPLSDMGIEIRRRVLR